jgi:transcriptional regulator with XRE-family HTH domain
MQGKSSVGEKLRSVRESRGLDPGKLAERAGVAVALVSQIESGELIPSLAPLLKLARALGVRLGTFLDDHEEVGPVIVKAGTHGRVVRFSDKGTPAHSDMDFFSLAANKAGRHMEPFIVELHPSTGEAARPAAAEGSAHEGEEFIMVLDGEVELAYGTQLHRLTAGDCVYYDSIVPHHVRAGGGGAARILAVVYAPL